MNGMRWFFPALLLFLLLTGAASAQVHFQPVAPTGEGYAIVVQDALFDDVQLVAGDEIAVFDAGMCVGASVVGTYPVSIIAWEGFPSLGMDGFTPGDRIDFRIWRDAAQSERPSLADYTVGDGTYGAGFASEVNLIATSGPVQFNLWTQDLEIPSGGGSLGYQVQLISLMPNSFTGLQYWTMVTLPNGNEIGPTLEVPFNMPSGINRAVNLTQNVPAMAPVGEYLFTGYAGYPNQNISDSFTFTKLGIATMRAGSDDWRADGSSFTEAMLRNNRDIASNTKPAAVNFKLSAQPNPFNSIATVGLHLQNDSEVRITVHDILGRTVAELANTSLFAGTHRFMFDAGDLPTGLYFVRTVADGVAQIHKISLIK